MVLTRRFVFIVSVPGFGGFLFRVRPCLVFLLEGQWSEYTRSYVTFRELCLLHRCAIHSGRSWFDDLCGIRMNSTFVEFDKSGDAEYSPSMRVQLWCATCEDWNSIGNLRWCLPRDSCHLSIYVGACSMDIFVELWCLLADM